MTIDDSIINPDFVADTGIKTTISLDIVQRWREKVHALLLQRMASGA